ncbi:MAG TPA: phosphatase PAP2 family protein [Candidatus Limnocylindria bacterium]|nr:phosphatase PAP2 family protein [Candidatus Limnocylindria bacterium]
MHRPSSGTSRARTALLIAVPLLIVVTGLLLVLAEVRYDIHVADLLPTPNLHRGLLVDEAVFFALTGAAAGIGLTTLTAIVATLFVHWHRYWAAAFVVVAVMVGRAVSLALKNAFEVPRPVSAVTDAIRAPAVTLPVLLAAVVVLGLVILFTRYRREAIVLLVLMVGLLIENRIASDLLPTRAGFDAFPSGHAVGSASLAIAFAAACWRSPRWRWWAIAISSLYAMGVALSRIYLHEHLFADVLAGWAVALISVVLAAGLVYLVRGLIDRFRPRYPSAAGSRT